MNDLNTPRKHGFHLSVWDGVVLMLGAILSIWLRNEAFPLWWIVPMVLGHFFLFCNVFLVRRRLELAWAGTFVANVMIHASAEQSSALSVLLWQLPITILVLAWQIRSPWYHGIAARRLNPRLNEYLNGTL